MQGKGLIKFIIIALAIACLYSLAFTWLAKKVEHDASSYAQGNPIKENAYLDSIALEPILSFPKFITYQYAKEREIPLGLDLKGGMNVTMEVSLKELLLDLANHPTDPLFNQAVAQAEALTKHSQKNFITLFGQAFEKLNPKGRLAPFFTTKDNVNQIHVNDNNDEVLSFLQKEAGNAIDRSFNILRTRIDKFGVTSPNIQRQEGSNRILIELPGVKDPVRVRKLLQGSAKLQFWETYDNSQISPLLESINKTLAANPSMLGNKAHKSDPGNIEVSKSSQGSKLAALSAKKDSAEQRGPNKGLLPSNKIQENPLFSILTPAYQRNTSNQAKPTSPDPRVGFVAQKDTALINRYLSLELIKNLIPAHIKFFWDAKPLTPGSKVFALYAVKVSHADGSPALEGEVITDAKADISPDGSPEVVMYMNADGARAWKTITTKAYTNNKQCIAIVLDQLVYSAPSVANPIENGISQITGNFSIEDTKDLANILKAGRLPAPAKIVEEVIVGPSLGEAAIHAGLTSSGIGLLVVLIFMILYYNRAGTVANIAVLMNMFFLMGVLASLGAVLTLPGIAGIVLTMGMAVDANVLIYERVREELSQGKSLKLAIADGYKHAMPSIIDAQATTFLTGIILYLFGTGPILGFATTLMIGILTSLFTAILISRVIFDWMLNKEWHIKFSNAWSSHTFKNANFSFVKNRFRFYIVSGLFITAGITSMFTRGFSLGVDFKGGRTYIVQYQQAIEPEKIRRTLDHVFGMTTEVKTFGTDNKYKITTSYLIEDPRENADQAVQQKLKSGLEKLGAYTLLSSQKVGPTIANDIKLSAVYAILFAIICIGLYILIRFRMWQFSIGAAIALLHDVLLVLSFFTLFNGLLPFSLDIDQAFIAAILTVMGYSINDTVVVFDRVREYLKLRQDKQDNMEKVINDAINSTLSRTIITALTVLFVLAVLFIFGGDVIRGFSFALLIGVIFGTYSSICVATPVVIDLQRKKLINKV